ncbi:hypothetical protein NLG97_g2202 [Lecanicillium saksenae]|uniref:Uncharacterized protein n=1 Tax=Lecanicillium saksenae TaxID=468837 RepID=A0ACC1R1N8_9HYPO|nr:hypothetical protein NLG97_g2202 [Lecanicillium saksenae]
MLDLIREAPLGQAIRFLSRNKLLQYPEEKPDFQLPPEYLEKLSQNEKSASSQNLNAEPAPSDSEQTDNSESLKNEEATYNDDTVEAQRQLALQPTKSAPIAPQKTADGIVLVDWYTTDDPANPQNWSATKRYFVVFVLCFYTWTVYCAGPIYATAEEGIQEEFGVSAVASTLGLSLYILAYGIGDLLFSPLTEIPVVGRNPVYYGTFLVFWILSFPQVFVNSFGGLLAIRFFLGFFGSPALANGGATIGDMFDLIYIPYGLSWWVFSAWAGPAFGPLLGGFAAMAKGWRWPLWEIVWMSSPALLFLLTLMPETSGPNILLRRAKRLRKLTGDNRLQSQSELDQRAISTGEMVKATLIRPVEIMMKDPAIFFVNVYTGYFYGVFYTFFEVFPLVFPVFYGMNLGETGITFLACFIGVTIGLLAYFAYLYFYMVPDNKKNGLREQEHRLVPAIIGSFLLPVGLFIFAWTSRSSIHWIVPLIGLGIFVVGHFWVMQSLFIYIPFSYPKYAASLFAGNSIWRSGIACGSVVFARPLFINLGVAWGTTLLAFFSVVGIFGTIALYVFGKKLRAKSKFAQS